ncbi:hypothetical protein L6164_006098 [Bauhinia variegata]|uniref:Uncharacterized protein n=1 Tax=Bauhinia variegata TaxID=167791 RepID=A0ACB9PSJ6_BAUVA|nr:hypothetical protein L6164_006098 [Bauhinia variegata]
MGTPVPTTETALSWTDEKHLHFLNTMEASFVRSMLQNDNGHGRRRIYHRLLRLDRPLPDTSDSTLDLKKPLPTARKHAPSDLMAAKGRPDGRRKRRRLTPPSDSSLDQVVPQLENGREEGGDDMIKGRKSDG